MSQERSPWAVSLAAAARDQVPRRGPFDRVPDERLGRFGRFDRFDRVGWSAGSAGQAASQSRSSVWRGAGSPDSSSARSSPTVP
jgi:hypothetical protein